MENASKALLMAGTILISLLVIGALVFVYRDITSAKRADEEALKTQQLEEFNKQFTSYERKLYGTELISLVNKMIDYNANMTSKGYKSMEIIIDKVPKGNKLFAKEKYKLDDLEKILKEVKNLEKEYGGSQTLSKIVEVLNKFSLENNKIKNEDKDKFNEELEKIVGVTGASKINNNLSDVLKYSEYIDFKRYSFDYQTTSNDTNNGRVVEMTFLYNNK